MRKSADEHFFSGSGPEILHVHSYGYGWVILVRRKQEREHASLKEVVKVKQAGVALTVLNHEREVFTRVVRAVPSSLKRLGPPQAMRGFLRSLICPGNFTPSGRSHTATVRIF